MMKIMSIMLAMIMTCSYCNAGAVDFGRYVLARNNVASSGDSISASDDFNRADSDTLGSLSGGTYTWNEVIETSLEVKDNNVRKDDDSGAVWGAAVLSPAVDVYSGYVQAEQSRGDSSTRSCALIFGYVDTDNYFYAGLSDNAVVWAGANKINLRKVVGGVDSEVTSGDYSVSSSTWYTIKVTFNTSTNAISVDVEGTEQLSTTDSDLTNGNVGFLSQQADQLVGGYTDDWSAVS